MNSKTESHSFYGARSDLNLFEVKAGVPITTAFEGLDNLLACARAILRKQACDNEQSNELLWGVDFILEAASAVAQATADGDFEDRKRS